MAEIKQNCFAHVSDDRYRGCYCLNELFCCKYDECRFYQTREEAKSKYLNNFNLETAQNISKSIDKYFRSL